MANNKTLAKEINDKFKGLMVQREVNEFEELLNKGHSFSWSFESMVLYNQIKAILPTIDRLKFHESFGPNHLVNGTCDVTVKISKK